MTAILTVLLFVLPPAEAAEPQQDNAAGASGASVPTKLVHHLQRLYQESTKPESPAAREAQKKAKPDKEKRPKRRGGEIQTDETGRLMVSITIRVPIAPVVAHLNALGAEVHQTSDRHSVIEASVEAALLPQIAAVKAVVSVSPVFSPITHAGTVMTQGDAVLNAEGVRALGYDGSPFQVGVLSDSA